MEIDRNNLSGSIGDKTNTEIGKASTHPIVRLVVKLLNQMGVARDYYEKLGDIYLKRELKERISKSGSTVDSYAAKVIDRLFVNTVQRRLKPEETRETALFLDDKKYWANSTSPLKSFSLSRLDGDENRPLTREDMQWIRCLTEIDQHLVADLMGFENHLPPSSEELKESLMKLLSSLGGPSAKLSDLESLKSTLLKENIPLAQVTDLYNFLSLIQPHHSGQTFQTSLEILSLKERTPPLPEERNPDSAEAFLQAFRLEQLTSLQKAAGGKADQAGVVIEGKMRLIKIKSPSNFSTLPDFLNLDQENISQAGKEAFLKYLETDEVDYASAELVEVIKLAHHFKGVGPLLSHVKNLARKESDSLERSRGDVDSRQVTDKQMSKFLEVGLTLKDKDLTNYCVNSLFWSKNSVPTNNHPETSKVLSAIKEIKKSSNLNLAYPEYSALGIANSPRVAFTRLDKIPTVSLNVLLEVTNVHVTLRDDESTPFNDRSLAKFLDNNPKIDNLNLISKNITKIENTNLKSLHCCCYNLKEAHLPSIENISFTDCDNLSFIDVPKATSLYLGQCPLIQSIVAPEARSLSLGYGLWALKDVSAPSAESVYVVCSYIERLDIPEATKVDLRYGKINELTLKKANNVFLTDMTISRLDLPSAESVSMNKCHVTTLNAPNVSFIELNGSLTPKMTTKDKVTIKTTPMRP